MKILIQQLEEVEDPRSGNAKVHNLADILFIAIAATVTDADSWYDVEEYAQMHEAAMETARMIKPDSIHKEVDADHKSASAAYMAI